MISKEEVEELSNELGPKPFIKEFSWTGKVTVGWSSNLELLDDPDVLKDEKIAIEQESTS